MDTDPLRYAGFVPRLASLMLDFIILLPLTALELWASRNWRLFDVYFLIPGTLFGLFYNVYLVRRFWEDDGQDSHDADEVRGGPDGTLSLTQARLNFKQYGASDRKSLQSVRKPKPEEV